MCFTAAVLSAVCILSGCGPGGSEQNDQEAEKPVALASLPAEIRNGLMAQCDYIDMIFYNAPISISQDNQNSVRSVVGFISPEPVVPDPDCEPTGRLTYIAQGEIAAEADFYFTDSCRYLLFIEDQEIVYGNKMTLTAINFFESLRDRIDASQQ